jgi:deazaflavin-dependent oxidoreductase (nitroreductase family)
VRVEIIKRKSPPTGLVRSLFRLPIQLYRWRLGWLLGTRFMLLTHTGRKTGRRRQVVIEVVGGARRQGDYLACSGFGAGAAWYRNILATPTVTIQVGRRRMVAVAEPLDAEAGAEVMATYASRNPWAARRLCRFMGFAVDGGEADFREVGRRLPFVRFTPRS